MRDTKRGRRAGQIRRAVRPVCHQLEKRYLFADVTSFSLINANTDSTVVGFSPIASGAVLNLATLPTRSLNVRANVTGTGTVASVRFGYDGNTNFRVDNSTPYSLGTGSGSNYAAWTPTVGSHTVTGRTYTQTNAAGTAGAIYSLPFSVIDTAPVTITANDAAAAEPTNNGQFTITRTGNTGRALTVGFVVSGTATNGSDYTTIPASVTIPTGAASATVTITTVNDTAFEGSETVVLTLAAGSGYAVSGAGSASVTIADNDAAPSVSVVATDAAAAEPGTNTGLFTVTRTGSTAAALLVNLTAGGTAAAGSDYAALPTTVVIPAGSASATVTVTPVDNAAYEANETVTLTVAAGAGYVAAAASTATVTIADNDQGPFTGAPVPVGPATSIVEAENFDNGGEGVAYHDTDATNVTGGYRTNVGVDIETAFDTGGGFNVGNIKVGEWLEWTIDVNNGGAASAAYDIGIRWGSLHAGGTAHFELDGVPLGAAFPLTGTGDWQTWATLTVPGQTLTAGVHVLRLSFDTTLNGDLGNFNYLSFTPATPNVAIAATDAAAAEPGTNAGTFTVTRTGSTAAALLVNLTAGGTATPGSDYAALPTTVTIPAGSSSATVAVNPVDDTDIEADETVVLSLAAGAGYNVTGAGTASVTIASDDVLPTITVAATDADAAEAGANAGEFTVTRTGPTTGALVVNLQAGGGATADADYAALPASVTIPAGSASVTVAVVPADDALIESDETVTLTAAADAAYTVSGGGPASVTIVSDDVLPGVSIAASDASAAEAGTLPGEFTVTRTGSTAADLVVGLLVGGTAAADSDYAELPASITIPAGSASATLSVTPSDDAEVEADETVTLSLTADAGYTVSGTGVATVTIASDDVLPAVEILATDANAAEAGSDPGEFTITRTGSTADPLVVTLTAGGSAAAGSDYADLPTSVTIPAGSSSATIRVTPVDDGAVEADETVTLSLAAGAQYDVSGTGSASVTIVSDDVLPIVTVAATDPDAAEAGADPGEFVVSRTGPTTADLVVTLQVGGTAAGAADYDAIAATVTIPAGSSSVTLIATPVDDTEFDPAETIVVSIGASAGYEIGAAASAAVTIADNDPEPPVVVSIGASDASAAEAGLDTGTFTVTRTGPTTAALLVNLVAGGTATVGDDYAALPTSVTVPAGSSSATVTVTPADDLQVEADETVTLSVDAGTGYITSDVATTASVTIASDDVIPAVTLTTADANASEAGGIPGSFTVTRTGPTTGPLTVNLSVGGTASAGSDYVGLSTTVTIPAGSTSASVTITPIDDAEIEAAETVVLSLDSGGDAYTIAGDGSGTVTIASDDLPEVSVAATDAAAAEAGADTGTFTVTRTGPTTSALVVNLTAAGTATAGSDYSTLPATLTIPAGSSSATLTVSPVDDAQAEADETVSLTLGADAAYTVSGGAAVVTIASDDLPEVTVSATDASAAEAGSNTGTFTVTRTGPTTSALVVALSTGGMATAGSDYSTLPTTVTIPAGSASAAVTVTPVNDADAEADETVTLAAGAGSGYTVSGGAATVTIVSDDLPVVSISASDSAASEPGTDTGTLTFTRTGPTSSALVVNLSVGGSAAAGSDYASLPATVTIPAGSSTATLTVSPIDDGGVESPETVIVGVSAGTGYATTGTPSATVTISDNDVLPTVTIAATDAAAGEATTPNTGTFTVTRTGATTFALTVGVNVTGTATSGSDYAALAATVTIPAGASSATLNVSPVDDALVENAETVVATLAAGSAYALGAATSATVTISDNDNGQSPFAGAFAIGTGTTTIQAENFDNGGEGIAYHDTDGTNVTGGYRTNVGVDIEAASDTGGGFNLGNIKVGEWLEYTIDVTNAGGAANALYNFALRFASQNGGGTVHFELDGTTIAGSSTNITGSGGWQTWKTVNISNLSLSSGVHVLRLSFDTTAGGDIGNLNWISVTPAPVANVPTVSVTATDAAAGEATTPNTGTFTVTRTGATTSALTVNLTLTGTATGGSDYTAIPTTVTIPAGSASATITVTPVNDTAAEAAETVVLTLAANPAVYALAAGSSSATVTIADNDSTSTAVPWPSSWQTAPNAPSAHYEAANVTVGDRIYMFGGFRNSNYQLSRDHLYYDAPTATWTSLGTMPVGVPESHQGITTDGRYIYMAGGLTGDLVADRDPPQFSSAAVWRFDTQTNAWLQMTSLPGTRAAGAFQLIGRRLHYVGGFVVDDPTQLDSSSHFVWDLDNPSAGWTNLASPIFARDHASSIVLNGKLYIMGGEPGHHHFTDQRTESQVYDPATNSWAQIASLPVAKSHDEGGTFIIDGRIIMAGGQLNDYQPTNNVVAYDPATNTWTTLTPLPAPRQGLVVAAIGNQVIVTLGGTQTNSPQLETWIGTLPNGFTVSPTSSEESVVEARSSSTRGSKSLAGVNVAGGAIGRATATWAFAAPPFVTTALATLTADGTLLGVSAAEDILD